MAISDWPEGERPREKLLALGAGALSDAELLAIFLRTGVPGKSAVDIARELITDFGSLGALLGATRTDFTAHLGLGDAKYAQLQAVVEMAKRSLKEDMRANDAMSSPGAVRDYLRLSLGQRPYEVFVAIFLDAQNRLIAADELFRGTLTQTSGSARSGEGRALAQRRGSGVCAQPPFRRG
jgi:DNA repair protein RadC